MYGLIYTGEGKGEEQQELDQVPLEVCGGGLIASDQP